MENRTTLMSPFSCFVYFIFFFPRQWQYFLLGIWFCLAPTNLCGIFSVSAVILQTGFLVKVHRFWWYLVGKLLWCCCHEPRTQKTYPVMIQIQSVYKNSLSFVYSFSRLERTSTSQTWTFKLCSDSHPFLAANSVLRVGSVHNGTMSSLKSRNGNPMVTEHEVIWRCTTAQFTSVFSLQHMNHVEIAHDTW